MKLKKHIRIKDANQVWRILISPLDKLIIETRNPDKKEAFFSCYNLDKGEKIFTRLQFEEKYWLGIEDIYYDIILFHRFTKPDMPGHKSIIAFDIPSKKVIWENKEYSFLFFYNDKIYCFRQLFEGRKFFTISPITGEVIDDLGDDVILINELKYLADEQKKYLNYVFPSTYNNSTEANIKEIIESKTSMLELSGSVEYLVWGESLFFNYHHKVLANVLENRLIVFNMEQKKIIRSEILNSSVNAFMPDSFFMYKNYLLLLKEKKEVLVLSVSE